MRFAKNLSLCALILVVAVRVNAQNAASSSTAMVPRLVNFSGQAADAQGRPTAGIAGVTFSIYADQSGGAPLWMETQNVNADAKGNYTAQLGATNAQGLPLSLFTSVEARWLGVRVNGGEEQPRVLLLSVPYAIKAQDAETVGGLPASAFMLAAPPAAAAVQSDVAAPVATPSSAPPPTSSDVTTSGGTANAIPLFSTATNIQNSIVTQTGTTAINIGGKLNLPASGAATASKGFFSRPLDFVASSYNSNTKAPVSQTFQWQAEQANNNTANPSAILTLLYGSGTTAPAETGLRIGPKGIISFVPGQTFPGGGSGTITGVKAGTALTGGGTSGTVTLNLDTTQVPLLAASNSFAAGQIVTTPGGNAIVATTAGQGNSAVTGIETATFGGSYGVYGETSDSAGAGVYGINNSDGFAGIFVGVNAPSGSGYSGASGVDIVGANGDESGSFATTHGGDGVVASGGAGGWDGINLGEDGVGGIFSGGNGSETDGGDGIDAYTGSGYAGYFSGNVWVVGIVSSNGESSKIDDPLDPANKYLSHSFVESPEMKNVYDGVATLDASGEATIQMPGWFGVLNRDFRYQLTCIGGFAPVYIAQKLSNNQFKIGGGHPGMEVSWQITGIRQDPWANAHRTPVEEEKDAKLKGFYINPELYGAPPEKQIQWARHPDIMKKMRQPREQLKQAWPSQSEALTRRNAK